MSKTILVDVDDTIEDLLGAWTAALNLKYHLNVSKDDITDWDISKFYPNLTEEQIYAPLFQDGFWKTVKPKQDAIMYVKKLFDEGYNIYLCTSTDYRNIKNKFKYVIQRYFPFIKWDKVIITYNKQMIKADYLIDDNPNNLFGGDYAKILMTAPHNKNYNAEENGMIRISNWREIYYVINKG